jgi:nucleotide-binding universal stress UspA family protein
MLNVKNILFPTDYSKCAAQALEHALYLAKHCRAKLHIVHATVLRQDDPRNSANHSSDSNELRERLSKIVMEEIDPDLKIYIQGFNDEAIRMEELMGFSAAELIVQYANTRNIDLIVMGTHGRRGLGYMFLGSIAQEVVRVAPCPVYTVRESVKPQSAKKKEVILSPVDFSDHSRAAISMAREAADMYGSKLELLHVIENKLYSAYNVFGEKTMLKLQQDIINQCRKKMRVTLDESTGPGVRAEFKIVTGHVVSEILEYARCNSVDLIAIATHGVTGLKNFLLGGVAEKVIRRAPCPVLTIRSFGRSLI